MDRIPEDRVVRAQPPVGGVRGAELVRDPAVPAQEHSAGDRRPVEVCEQREAESWLEHPFPQEPEESAGLGWDAESPARSQVQRVVGVDDVTRPLRTLHAHALTLSTSDVAANL